MDSELINAARAAMDAGQVTQDGKPLVTAMETTLGRNVTADERDAAYSAILAEAGETGTNSNRSENGTGFFRGVRTRRRAGSDPGRPPGGRQAGVYRAEHPGKGCAGLAKYGLCRRPAGLYDRA